MSLTSQVELVVKNPPTNAGDMRDTYVFTGSVPAWGRELGRGNGSPLRYPCLENPLAEEPGGLQSMRSQRVGHDRSYLAHST